MGWKNSDLNGMFQKEGKEGVVCLMLLSVIRIGVHIGANVGDIMFRVGNFSHV